MKPFQHLPAAVETASRGFRLALVALLGMAASLSAREGNGRGDDLPLFDFEAFIVDYHPTDLAPGFRVESPQFTYFEQPELERGELILALEFMDRYRESLVPGEYKWAGMLHFPVIDGQERPFFKWLCLYFYNGQMFGYDPGAAYESERRFIVPIRYENRMDPSVLFQFAESYVEEVFPARTEEVLIYEEALSFGDEEESSDIPEEYWETIDIPAGRIASILPSGKGKDPQELVRLIYRYAEEPNPGMTAVGAFGPAEEFGKTRLSWKISWKEMFAQPDYLDVAQQLLAPRWSQKLYFHYTNDLWILPDYHGKASALAFNIGTRIYVYAPRYGVWRTDAALADLEDPEALALKLRYPGLDVIDRVEFLPVAASRPKGK